VVLLPEMCSIQRAADGDQTGRTGMERRSAGTVAVAGGHGGLERRRRRAAGGREWRGGGVLGRRRLLLATTTAGDGDDGELQKNENGEEDVCWDGGSGCWRP
jgi:hypothetical protein